MSDALRGLQGARHAWWGRCRQQMFPPERAQPSNENKMSDGGRGRALLGVEVWKSSQKWSAQRSAVRSIARLDASSRGRADKRASLLKLDLLRAESPDFQPVHSLHDALERLRPLDGVWSHFLEPLRLWATRLNYDFVALDLPTTEVHLEPRT